MPDARPSRPPWSRRAALALGLAAALGSGTPGRAATVPLDPAAITRRVEALRQESGANAAIVGIDRGGRERLHVAAGHSLPGERATEEMEARIGAMSITALAVILLQLAEEGVVGLDDPLERWLPGYPEGGRITLRMLANSTSGYADYVAVEEFVKAFYADPFAGWTADQVVAIALARGMQHEPGEGFTYTHAGFTLLARALERAAGQPLEALVRARIIAPLGLRRTHVRADAALAEPVLHAYTTERGIYENSTFWNPSWTAGTGFLTSDGRDLLTLARAFGSGALLPPGRFAEMIAPASVGKGGNRAEIYYGLGIIVRPPWIMQTFSFGGYDGAVGHLPGHDLTIAVVTTQGRTSDPAINHAMRIFEALRDDLTR